MKINWQFIICFFVFTPLQAQHAWAEEDLPVPESNKTPPSIARPVAKKAVWGDPVPAKKKPIQRKFFVTLATSYLLSPQTKNKLTGQGLVVPVETANDPKTTANTLEFIYHNIKSTWGLAFIAQTSKYNYQVKNHASDRHIGFWVAPRIQATWDSWHLWGSLGLGMMRSSFPASTYIDGSYQYDVRSKTSNAFSYTIRLGADFFFTENKSWFVSPHIIYDEFSGKTSGTITNTVSLTSAAYTNTFTRSWVGVGIKLGYFF